MPRYIAFLRAINVGGHTVKMDHLRRLFEALDFDHVATFIASGNVIFETSEADTAAVEQRIAEGLEQSLGYAVATFLRAPADLAAVAAYQPFPAPELDAEGHSLYVAFLPAPPSAEARDRLLALHGALDDFHIHDREVYWLVRGKMTDSAFSGAVLEKTLGLPATVRNITTVRKLAAKYPA